MKYRKINISEINGYSGDIILPEGSLFLTPDNQLKISDGVTVGGIEFVNSEPNTPKVIYPTAGNGVNGIIFPSDPEGGSGDIASIKYYGIDGEKMRLHINVENDNDDEIMIESTGDIKIQSNDNLWTFTTGGTLEFPGGTVITNNSFIAADGENAVMSQYDGNTQIYTLQTGVGIQTYDTNNNTWLFLNTGILQFPNGTEQTNAWSGGRVVNVPYHSYGSSGDITGDLAFDSDYVYYCTTSYTSHMSSITIDSAGAWGGEAGGLTSIPFLSTSRVPQIGWTINGPQNEPPYTATLTITGVNSLGDDRYDLQFDLTNLNISNGVVWTLTDDIPQEDIWKRISWSNDTW